MPAAGVLVALALALTPSLASAQEPLALAATTAERGWIAFALQAPAGMPVTISETAGAASEPVAAVTGAGETTLERASSWRCDRRVRTFVATAADGRTAAAEARTPTCRDRLALTVPRRARPARVIAVGLRDRWGHGEVPVQLCVRPPGGPVACGAHRVAAPELRVRVRVERPGVWRLRAQTPWGAEVRTVRVARRNGRLRLLVTGDSMIQPLDDYLRLRLRPDGVGVTSDPRISTGISKPSFLDWPAHARRQTARLRPDVTVMFLGANDGFPIGDAPCCGAAWVRAYAARVRGMMETYARRGRGRVYWLTLPAPRGGFFRRTFPAVNAALRQAAAGAPAAARLIRLDRYFTPGGRFRQAMRIGGRTVQVRQRDGVHLSKPGAAAAASRVVRALRREQIVG